jgi:DNA-binding transcriptional LysR family regulator
MFDLNDIVLFTKLVESKTLTSAADALGLPKSTLSRRLSQLEAQLSVKLFERNTRHFTLTDVGMAYYTRCSEIVAKVASANQHVMDLQVAPRGRIRMTAPTDLSSRYVGAILAEFTKEHSEINIELTVTDRVVNLVEDSFDIALRITNAAHAGNLVSITVGRTFGILCASPAYIASHGSPTQIEDLYSQDLVLFMPAGMHSFTLTDGNTTHEIAPPVHLVADHYAPIRDALLAGAGIGVMTDYAVARELASGELVRVLPEWSSGELEIRVVHPARSTIPPRITLLLDHLVKHMSPPPWEREIVSS